MMVVCPRCGKPAVFSPQNAYRPFCSKRCKDSDLYGWLTEEKEDEGEFSHLPEEGLDAPLPAPSPKTRQ